MSEKLTPKQRQMIAALLTNSTYEKAAAEVGITSRTLRRWKEKPVFREAFSKALDDTLGETVRHFAMLDRIAFRRLQDLMRSPDESIAIRALGTYYAERRQYHMIASFNERLIALENERYEQRTITD